MLNSLIDKINAIVYRVSTLGLTRVLILGLVIRIGLMPFTAHPFDVYIWYRICNKIVNQGMSPYEILSTPRPLWILTLVLIGYTYNWLSSVTGIKALPVNELPSEMDPKWGIKYIPGPLFNILVKIPMLISDTLLAILLYKMMSKYYDEKKGITAATLFYLNPAVIWISAAWGQYETVPALFTVLSIYLFVRKRYLLSSSCLLIATAYKAYPIAVSVPMLICLLKRREFKGLVKFLSLFIILIPILHGISKGIYSLITGSFCNVTGFGLTYWSISLLIPLDPIISSFTSSILVVISLMYSLYLMLKINYNNPLRDVTLLAVIMGLGVFLTYRYLFEQRFSWLVPLLITVTSIEPRILGKVLALSLLTFFYAQKNFPYYLLPIATLNSNILLPLFHKTSSLRNADENVIMPTIPSALILAILGILFSLIALSVYIKLIKIIELTNNHKEHKP